MEDPDLLPRHLSESTVDIISSSGSPVDNGNSTFFNNMARVGAVIRISTDDSWVNVVNVTGKGFLGNVIAPHCNSANKAIGIRVIRDGVEWTWELALTNVHQRSTMVLGALSAGSSGIAAQFPVTGRESSRAGWSTPDGPAIVPVEYLLSDGKPVLSFDQSLVVSVKGSAVNQTAEGDQAACTYTLR